MISVGDAACRHSTCRPEPEQIVAEDRAPSLHSGGVLKRSPRWARELFFLPEESAEDSANPLGRRSDGLPHGVGYIRNKDRICRGSLDKEGKLAFRLTEGCE